MNRQLARALLLGSFSVLAGCSAHLSTEAIRFKAQLQSACVGIVGRDVVSIDDRRVPLPGPRDWDGRGLTSDGHAIIGRRAVLNLKSWTIEELQPPLPGRLIDVSADGSRVLLSEAESNAPENALFVLDRATRRAEPVTSGATDAVISPDGKLVAVQMKSEVTVYQGPTPILEVRGRFPSWLDAKTLAYLRSSKSYEIVDVTTGQRRAFRAVGKPETPLRRSNGSQLLYATRTIGDFWSDLGCMERYRLIVHDAEGEPGIVIRYGCKGSSPRSFLWINNAELCAAGRGPDALGIRTTGEFARAE